MIARRQSLLRTEIINLLRKHHLFSAPEILGELLIMRKVNKTSVYRSLEILLEQALIVRHDFTGQETKYELAERHHDHFVCLNCHQVEEIDCALNLPTLIDGKSIQSHELNLYGRCQNCQPRN